MVGVKKPLSRRAILGIIAAVWAGLAVVAVVGTAED
jgi:hypothetical protein